MTEDRASREQTWWGSWSFDSRPMLHWRIGPLDLWIQHLDNEWLVRRVRADDPLDMGLAVADTQPLDKSSPQEVDRIVAHASNAELKLRPRLADRPVVVRPDDPFHLLAGSSIRLYVSSPVWISLEVGQASAGPLLEMPIFRPSDTWFGSSTISGSAAYAVSTSCRTDLDGLPIRPHRAVTPLQIHNPGPDRLNFERLAVPLPNLSLYQGHDGRLWTELVKVAQRADETGLADVEVQPGAPLEAGEAIQIDVPRNTAPEGIFRVFDALF